jgi:hypothetical protein
MVKAVREMKQNVIGGAAANCTNICNSSEQGCFLPKVNHTRHGYYTQAASDEAILVMTIF